MTPQPDQISVLGPAAGDRVNVLGAPIRILSRRRAGALFFADHDVPPGYAVPTHVHEDEDELFYILEGQLTVEGPDGLTTAEAGDFVHLPRGVPHGFANRTDSLTRMLVIATPDGGLEGVFRDLDAAATAGSLTPEGVGAITAANAVRML